MGCPHLLFGKQGAHGFHRKAEDPIQGIGPAGSPISRAIVVDHARYADVRPFIGREGFQKFPVQPSPQAAAFPRGVADAVMKADAADSRFALEHIMREQQEPPGFLMHGIPLDTAHLNTGTYSDIR